MKLELFKKDEKTAGSGGNAAAAEESAAVMIPPEAGQPLQGSGSADNRGPTRGAAAAGAEAQQRTVNWTTLRHVTLAQMGLAMIAAVCVLGTVFFGSMTPRYMWYKTSIFFWVLYLISTAYCGYRSGPRSYCHLVAYFVMSILQTVINGIWLSFTTMVVFHTVAQRNIQLDSTDDWTKGGYVAIELVETAALCLTIFTGMLGIVTCCKGIGRLLEHVDNQIMRGVRF